MPVIVPVKELANTAGISKLCHETQGPVFVTKNGYSDMVIMSAEVYDGLVEAQIDMDIAISEAQVGRGEGVELDDILGL